MKLLQLTLQITPGEADTIITFLNEMKALLAERYGDDIGQHRRSQQVNTRKEEANDDF